MATLDRPAVRKSLPLSARDIREIELLRGSSVHRNALERLSAQSINDDSSEATVLHAIVEAGLKAVLEEVEEAGYAELANEYDAAARQAVSRRRRPAWADE